MNLKILLLSTSFYEVGYHVLIQVDIIPIELLQAFKDFPLLFIFLGSLYYLMKWLEKMLEAQRVNLREIYDNNQVFLSNLLSQIEVKQNKMSDRIELLTQQVAIVNATVAEVAKIDDVVDKLMDRLDDKNKDWKGL